MAGKEQIAEALSSLMKKHTERGGFLNITKGIAKAVDEAKGTFTLVRDNEDDYPGVSLNAFFESEGHLILVPKEGSVVVVGFADGNQDAFIVQASQIQKIKCKIGAFELTLDKDMLKSTNTDSEFMQTKDKTNIKKGNISLEINNSGAVFNGGTLDGLPKLGALVGKLNAIENKVNDLTSKFNSHKHSATGTSATGGPVTILATGMSVPNSLSSGSLNNTSNSDLENPKVKQ